MHVYKRPNGRWQVIVQVNGHRRTATATTRQAALQRGAELIVSLGRARRRTTTPVTIEELLAHHLAAQGPRLSPSTLAEYQRVAANLPADLADLDVATIIPRDLADQYRRLFDTGWSIGSVRRLHELLHAAYRQTAVLNEWAEHNPVSYVRKPARAPHRIDPPDVDTVRRLLADAGPDLRMFLRVAATTGARRGELVALRWDDVDLEAGDLTITRSHVYTPASGVVERPTKTGRSGHRRIALAAGTVPLLEDHRARLTELADAANLPAPVWVFSSDAGVTPWRPDYPTTAFNRLRDRAGVTGVRLHDLRHFVATQLLGAGESPVQVAARLGHSSPRTTLEVYASWLPARDREAAARLGARLE